MAFAAPLPLPRALLPAVLAVLAASSGPVPARAQVQVQLQCAGTLLETRGSAELKRDTQRLAVSLGLEAEAADADGALAALQRWGDPDQRSALVSAFLEQGFSAVSVDLEGLVSGKLNRSLRG